MSEIKLLRHGEHINSAYLSGSGKNSRAEKSTDAARPDGRAAGIAKRYRKRDQAAALAVSIGLIKAEYADAIEYIGIRTHLRGLILLTGAIAAATFIGGGVASILSIGHPRSVEYVFIAIFYCFIIFGVYCLLMAVRHELFRPQDEPIIFDRRHRKVYRLFRESYPGVIGLFRPWPMRAAEYDWDLIDVEHYVEVVTTGETVRRQHSLLFIVRRSKSDPTIIDGFDVIKSIELSEHNVGPIWEHIRRFMEAHGPHLQEGETLALQEIPTSLWESIGSVSPFGPKYLEWWRERPFTTGVYHLTSPFVLPVFLAWGTFNWMSHKSSFPAAWPAEVIDAVTRP